MPNAGADPQTISIARAGGTLRRACPLASGAGFGLRGDAGLLLRGSVEEWATALVDAKGGDADAVVLLVITTDVEDPDGLCDYTGTITPHELRPEPTS